MAAQPDGHGAGRSDTGQVAPLQGDSSEGCTGFLGVHIGNWLCLSSCAKADHGMTTSSWTSPS